MKRINKLAIGVLFAGILTATGLLTAENTVSARPQEGVLVSATSHAKVTDVVVSTVDNDVRVQFNYEVANGAASADIDATLNEQRSIGFKTITGPGRYDETITNVPDGNYGLYLYISGNPNYLVADPGPSNQPLVITLPAGTKKYGMGDQMMRWFRQYFHAEQKLF